MNKTFTQNDIIRFIYGEMEHNEAALFQDSLKVDEQLRLSFFELSKTMQMVDSLKYSASVSDFTLLKIKSYARAYSSTPSEWMDSIDIVLN